MSTEKTPPTAPVDAVVMPLRVWRKMTPQEYAKQHKRFGRHVAVSQEIVEGCQEVWVFLGGSVRFESTEDRKRAANASFREWCKERGQFP